MTGFHRKQELELPDDEIKCGYCGNRFKGNSSAHTRELYNRHVARKHPDKVGIAAREVLHEIF